MAHARIDGQARRQFRLHLTIARMDAQRGVIDRIVAGKVQQRAVVKLDGGIRQQIVGPHLLRVDRQVGRIEMQVIARRRALRVAERIACRQRRSEEHTSELQSLMRISYAVFCLTKNNTWDILYSTPYNGSRYIR